MRKTPRGDSLIEIRDGCIVYIDTNILLAHFLLGSDRLKPFVCRFFENVEKGRCRSLTSTVAV